MTPNDSLYRKIAYMIGIVLLLLPIFYLGQPATRGGGQQSEGGKLEQLRDEYDLGQADIGAIDPASEAIRLATLGARGIATTLLWSKVNNYKMTEDWTGMEATLKQLAKLQPYFIAVWRYQAWNLSYNVSVELDDVKDRFFYVKEGIKYLDEGTQYNRDNPSLLSDLGWFIGNKIGRADEHEIYRQLYKADDELHDEDTRPEQRDNWLVSKDYYETAVSVIDDKKKSLGQKNPTTFFDKPAKSQINYAEAIEHEGTFGERARRAWETAGRMWRQYGNRQMMSSFGVLIRLEDAERAENDLKDLVAEIEALAPGLREQMIQEAEASLTDEERAIRKKEADGGELTDKDWDVLAQIEDRLDVTPQDLADRIAREMPDQAMKVRRLANQIDEVSKEIRMIESNSEVANYPYWRARCDFEQTPEALRAQELRYNAYRLWKEEGQQQEARQLYEEAFALWAQAFEKTEGMSIESVTGGDIMVFVEEYGELLEQLDLSLMDEELAEQFPLWEVIARHDQSRMFVAELAAQRQREGAAPKDRDAESLVNPTEAFTDVNAPTVDEEPTEEADDEASTEESTTEESTTDDDQPAVEDAQSPDETQ